CRVVLAPDRPDRKRDRLRQDALANPGDARRPRVPRARGPALRVPLLRQRTLPGAARAPDDPGGRARRGCCVGRAAPRSAREGGDRGSFLTALVSGVGYPRVPMASRQEQKKKLREERLAREQAEAAAAAKRQRLMTIGG